MIIGYSFWGFLGNGITDTPDGGRSHRRVLIEGLRALGHDLVFLQENRDLAQADDDLTSTYEWDEGFPEVDALVLEWRWPIVGRNTTSCGTVGHTCDLHRQRELLHRYTTTRRVPTVIWDKDLNLTPNHSLRRLRNVAVCEAALHPRLGARSLLFPVNDAVLDAADPAKLATAERPRPLVYVGNQYDRDEAFDRYFAPAAARWPHTVAGKWTRTASWPLIDFRGRVPFSEVASVYSSTLATVLLLPDRCQRIAQMTQRLPEAVLSGCLPITPTTIRDAHRFTPTALHTADGEAVGEAINKWLALAGTQQHVDVLAECLARLDLFRVSTSAAVLDDVLRSLLRGWRAHPSSE